MPKKIRMVYKFFEKKKVSGVGASVNEKLA